MVAISHVILAVFHLLQDELDDRLHPTTIRLLVHGSWLSFRCIRLSFLMPSHSFTLGETEHRLACSNIKLLTIFRFRVTVPNSSFTYRTPQELVAARLWITRGKGLNLRLRLALGAIAGSDSLLEQYGDGFIDFIRVARVCHLSIFGLSTIIDHFLSTSSGPSSPSSHLKFIPTPMAHRSPARLISILLFARWSLLVACFRIRKTCLAPLPMYRTPNRPLAFLLPSSIQSNSRLHYN